ncbi:MAG: sugar ABC transporter ATP-binding protein, partial [Planctomycetota bacterium]
MTAAAPPPALRMRGVVKRFGPVTALDGVDLEVRAGEVHALLGENGAGKSTLMKILAGVHRADAGTVELGGKPFAPRRPQDALDQGVAMVYQELNLAPDLSVADNVALGREAARRGLLDRRANEARVAAALARLGRPDLDPRTPVRSLGPAARQVVEIARALVFDARVVVLDEPTSSLASADVERLFAVVRRLRAEGVAVVYISHFLEEVQQVADRYTVLRDGRTVGAGEVAGTPLERIVELMAGRRLEEFFPRVPHEPGEVLLEVRGLAGVPLPRSVSLELRRGEILGIAGLVGAGRTEFLRALFALEPVRAGEVRIGGLPAPARGPRRRLAQGMGLLSEDRKEEGLALGLSLAHNLTLSRLGPVAPGGVLRPRLQAAAARRWMERLGIRAAGPEQPVGDLSGGNQQKVALARLLHHDVDILLCDEPTRGIDVGAKTEVYRVLGELAAAGKAVLVVSSYLPELFGVCDRIAVMHRGVLGPARPTAEWTEAAVLDAAA